jgi:hypothetical protein
MTAINPERSDAEQTAAEEESPEQHAPPRSAPAKLGDLDQAVNAFEGEIREFVRRDVGGQRKPRDPAPKVEASAENMNALIQRVSGASMDEIDRVITELQGVREMLRSEGERVSREISSYASLSHAAMTAMKVIGESITQWKKAPSRTGGPRAAE